ncbi:MAG TPA: peptidoglycan-associated lipoprotein Pal [Elusimicrobiota bacterium]|nr:peptidoglycan-associated lipoprotein Pal [Elusimicrobiota bacterium]
MKKTGIGAAGVTACALSLIFTAGCAHMQKTAAVTTAPANAAAATNASEPVVRESVIRSIPELKTVHFAYNSADLSAATRAILRANAAWLKEHVNTTVQVSGNCDQRGTEEYNLALGQRRAEAVRRYYSLLGVTPHRVATISYGKDKPLCGQMTQACWRQNRRAETLLAEPAGVAGK